MTDLSPLLRIRDAHVRRAGREILAVDEFSLAEGESAALLGPNGSGKSTFIGLITREIHPLHRDEAPVLFRGDARVTLADIKRALGVVSSTMQDQIRVHVPAQDIVAGGLFGSLGIPQRCTVTDGQRARARAIMSELGIGDLAERDILTLSTGQARRVLIARALVQDPLLMLADEPIASLDPKSSRTVMEHLRWAADELGVACLANLHQVDFAMEFSDRIVALKKGRVVFDGAPHLLDEAAIADIYGTNEEAEAGSDFGERSVRQVGELSGSRTREADPERLGKAEAKDSSSPEVAA